MKDATSTFNHRLRRNIRITAIHSIENIALNEWRKAHSSSTKRHNRAYSRHSRRLWLTIPSFFARYEFNNALNELLVTLDNHEFSYRIEPAWFFDLRHTSSPAYKWKLPSPLIVDLNGDQHKEVLLITKDFQLTLLSAEPETGSMSEIYHPVIRATYQLPKGDIEVGKTPVAMGSGYGEPYHPQRKRSQVIVVVNEDASLSCFNSTLSLLWWAEIFHKQHSHRPVLDYFFADDVSVLIQPLSLEENSAGVVIVGVSLSLRPGVDKIELEKGIQLNESGDDEHPYMRAKAQMAHFNIHAFDARTGRLIWSHNGFEVNPEQYTKSLPKLASKLDRRDLITQIHHAPGMQDWSVFRNSLLEELPHDWHDRTDSSMRVAHFERQQYGSSAAAAKKSSSKLHKKKRKELSGIFSKGRKDGKLSIVESAPLERSAALPHDASEHTAHPNVLGSVQCPQL